MIRKYVSVQNLIRKQKRNTHPKDQKIPQDAPYRGEHALKFFQCSDSQNNT